MEQLLSILFVVYLVITFLVSLARKANRGGEQPDDADVFPFPPDLREEQPNPSQTQPDVFEEPRLDPAPMPMEARSDVEIPVDRQEAGSGPMPSPVPGPVRIGTAKTSQPPDQQADFTNDEAALGLPGEEEFALEASELGEEGGSMAPYARDARSSNRQRKLLHNRRALEDAILVREVLGPPRAVKPHRPLEWLRP